MKNRMSFHEKRDPLISAGFIALVLCLAFRIPLMQIIGAEGIAFFAPVNELFLLCIAFFSSGFSDALSGMLKYRVKREQFKNAGRIFRVARNITIAFAVLILALLLFFNNYLSNVIFLQNYSRMALIMIIPAIVLMIFTCLLRGYFGGMGSPYPTAHSLILEQVFTIISALLCAKYFITYGEKVAALLRDESFALAYGAFGAVMGISAAAAISFLHLLFIYFMYLGTGKRRIYRDNTRQIETPGYLYQSLLFSSIPIGIFVIFYHINHLIDQRVYYYFFNKLNEDGGVTLSKTEVWGNYYGIFLVITGIITAALYMITVKNTKLIAAAWIREEYRYVREQLMQMITALLVGAVPLAVLIAVLAEPLISILGQGSPEIATKLLQGGSVLIILNAFNLYWIDLLKQFKRTAQMLLLGGGGLAVHIVSLLLLMTLVSEPEQLISRIIIANIIGSGFMFALGFFFTARMFKYQGEWLNRNIRTLAITLLCGATMGLMAMLLSMAILDLVGPHVTILVCFLISVVAYFVLMMLLRGLSVNDLDRLPGGQILIRLGRLIRFF